MVDEIEETPVAKPAPARPNPVEAIDESLCVMVEAGSEQWAFLRDESGQQMTLKNARTRRIETGTFIDVTERLAKQRSE